jgi:class 3 adenylate cyclase
VANQALDDLLKRRKPILTAKRLLTNQTFRDIHRTDTLAIGQRLKILNLTFLFSDLKDSTELYERVGDLVAFDLVNEHFRVLQEIIASERGAVVKTIGDAVMATFETPDRAIAAAIRMREAMSDLGAEHQHQSLRLKTGIHEGPCLAVTLNAQQDYFGQTVNVASRVQGLAGSRSIVVTEQVVENAQARALLESRGLMPTLRRVALTGIADKVSVYEVS